MKDGIEVAFQGYVWFIIHFQTITVLKKKNDVFA